jgi:hypothetical protein
MIILFITINRAQIHDKNKIHTAVGANLLLMPYKQLAQENQFSDRASVDARSR